MAPTGRTLDTGQFFNRPEFSDVTIRFSGREVPCHKLILCTQSRYFAKLCGPQAGFAEAHREVIELRDDDPEALEQVLRYLYFGQYARPPHRDADWAYHLAVARTAAKYLLDPLADAAFEAFRTIVEGLKDVPRIWDAIVAIRAEGVEGEGGEAKVLVVADALERRHLLALMRDPYVRAEIGGNAGLMWKYMDQVMALTAGFGAQTLTDGLAEAEVFWCGGCDAFGVCEKQGRPPRQRCGRRFCRPADTEVRQIWLRKQDEEIVIRKADELLN